MKNKIFIIARYFIAKNKESQIGLTNKKLQKLLYYSQAWNLVLNNKKIFPEEIQAWIHGPAIPSVYQEYKKFEFNDIDDEIDEKDFSSLTKEEILVLDAVWDVYGKYDANYLELLTHSEEPWIKARNKIPSYMSSSATISPAHMKEYYGRQISK